MLSQDETMKMRVDAVNEDEMPNIYIQSLRREWNSVKCIQDIWMETNGSNHRLQLTVEKKAF